MKRILTAVIVLCAVVLGNSMLSQALAATETPTDRVVVMYFHRTQRCPTCKKMGAYAEEAVMQGFAKELKSGKVEFHFIDFQDEKNEALTKGYKVQGPTLIVAQVVNKKVKDQKNLKEMWTKVRDKDAFIEYVQSNVKEYLKKKETTAASPDKKTK